MSKIIKLTGGNKFDPVDVKLTECYVIDSEFDSVIEEQKKQSLIADYIDEDWLYNGGMSENDDMFDYDGARPWTD